MHGHDSVIKMRLIRCSGYLQDTRRIPTFWAYLLDIGRISAGYLRDICRISAGYLLDTCRIPAGYLQDPCRISAGYLQAVLSAGYLQDIWRISAGCRNSIVCGNSVVSRRCICIHTYTYLFIYTYREHSVLEEAQFKLMGDPMCCVYPCAKTW